MKVAVLMGGTSDERAVSLASGVQVCAALREAGHAVIAVDTAHGVIPAAVEDAVRANGVDVVPPAVLGPHDPAVLARLLADPMLAGVDVFFMALHGGAGEDGTVQAQLDRLGVAYTASGPTGCALAMDKVASKQRLRQAGVATPDWMTGLPDPDEVVARLGLPVIVKAASGGSSLRLHLAHDRDELLAAHAAAARFGDLPLWERFIRGREFTVSVLGDDALPVGEIIPQNELFDYECKYQPGMAQEIFPADIEPALARRMQQIALEVHRILQLRDVSRIDFMVDAAGEPWCLEANALPGMTANSLLPRAARAAGLTFADVCDRIVRMAADRGTGGGAHDDVAGRNPAPSPGV